MQKTARLEKVDESFHTKETSRVMNKRPRSRSYAPGWDEIIHTSITVAEREENPVVLYRSDGKALVKDRSAGFKPKTQ